MASRTYMQNPVCLIENTKDGKLMINKEAMKLLYDINEIVVVVSIVGFYRTGKSYLMNRLAGKTHGFSLGSTVQSHTKGIWMWCVPHPTKHNHCLVLLDTEGLGDVEKGDKNNDCWIFALAVLLSSTFIYNSVGTIDQSTVDKLHYVSELTELIKVKDSDEDDSDEEIELLKVSPAFVWVVRDFTLQLKIGSSTVTEDQYLNHALQIKSGNGRKVMEYNMPRQCIRNFFRSRKLFTFVRPTTDQNLHQVETLPESQLEALFVDKCREFCQYVFTESEPKTIKGGHRITGRKLAILVKTYVDTIASGAVPCLENAVTSLAKIENTAAITDALTHYKKQMEKMVELPVVNEKLTEIHTQCQKEAFDLFMRRSFGDQDQEYYKQLVAEVQKHYFELCHKNEAASMEKCGNLLGSLSAEMEKKLREGFYARPGGYKLYQEDRQKMISEFHSTTGNGIKAEDALNEFLKQKALEGDSVLQADKMLTDKDKQLAVEKERAAQVRQERNAQEEKLRSLEELRKNEKITHEENVQQLTKKLEEEKENMKREQETALESLKREQKELLEKGFTERSNEMQKQIQTLEEQLKTTKTHDIMKTIGTLIFGVAERGIDAYASYKTVKLHSGSTRK
ncbi:guanylate-binding protein 1-like [Heptranchias perlo]|uniref:guanylate-binding protein 1-like n=1 Tax=Heptranchias perlo TaxID=212740 RepID=UPI003559589A